MRKSNICILLALALPVTVAAGGSSRETVTPPIQSSAQGDWMDGLGAGFQVGTQGVGLHFSYNFTPSFYLSLDGNYFDYSKTINVDGIDYDADLDLSNLGLTANYLPFENLGFRITGGAFFSNNNVSGTARGAGQNVNVNDVNYILNAADSINGTAEWNTCNPYLGLGWDWVFGTDLNFVIGLDIGVLYLGEPDATLTGTGQFTSGVAAADLAAEQQAFHDEVDGYKFQPVIKLSFTYRF